MTSRSEPGERKPVADVVAVVPRVEPTGLRERKKARTKATIQRHAVRLFQKQGFAATTVEQVAEAAEVAASTVFRYFPSKEDLVASDDWDPIIWESFASQPASLSLVQAWKVAIRAAVDAMTDDDLATGLDRGRLMFSVPELWGASLHSITTTLDEVIRRSAQRVGRDPDDPEVRSAAGAIFGVMLSVMFAWVEDPGFDIVESLNSGLDHLDAGFSF